MNFEGEVETQVSDQIAAGASYDQNSGKFAPKTLFTRWTAKGGDPFKATATYNVAAATAEVDVEYEKFGSTFSAKFNSARETLITAADACRDFTVDGRKLKLAPSHDFVSGVSSLKSNLALSDDTSVELKLNSDNIGNSDALTGTLSVDHNIDKINSIKHTFALDSGAATHEFRRTLDGDAKFSVAASPGHSVEVEWDEASSKSLWTTNVRMPWGQYDRASVSFKRKFKIAAGATYDQNGAKFKPKTLFTRWTAKGGDPLKVTAIINVADNAAEVDVAYEKFGSKFSANFNSACAQLITTADASRDFTAKLNSNLGNSDAPTGTLSIDHTIDSIYSIKHSFALDSGAARHEFRRKLEGDAKLSVAASPGHSVEVEWDETGSKSLWTTNVRMPWGQYDRASVSFKRKFKV
ncbi:hypothetical protein JL720_3934 [Aureococcus anophagefferens]|nr:hypothetical protein JL720_3934 [Aureococcus anophagefferens]